MLEMPVGHFAIVGAFNDFDNAQEYSDKLFELGYGASFGYLTEKKLFEAALQLDSEQQRAAFLDAACAGGTAVL